MMLALTAMLLTACSGGGGSSGNTGSSQSISTVLLKSSWEDAKAPNTQVQADGLATRSSYLAPLPSHLITRVTNNGFDTSQASGAITYDGAGEILGIAVSAHGVTHSWRNEGNTYVTAGDTTVGVSSDYHSTRGLFANPHGDATVWNYQSFGYWLTGYNNGGGELGAVSFGWETPASAIPTSGTTDFNGFASGTYISSQGELHTTQADVYATVNFGTRQVNIYTTNTYVKDLATSTLQAKSGLNFSGTLNYNEGQNHLRSSSLTTSSGLSGSAEAKFYGPALDEMGGVFSLTDGGIESYQGAFGAKQ